MTSATAPQDQDVFASAAPPRAVLFDFGGVLTTSVFESFASCSREISGDPDLLLQVVAQDEAASAALVEHECGRIEDEEFEAAVARGLAARGVQVEPHGLIVRMQRGLERDVAMRTAVESLRERGIAVALVSNSLGRDCYTGHDLDALFDVQVISGREGVRKPSRALYRIACERLGVSPGEALMVDDLAINVRAAHALGLGGVVHRSAARTVGQLADLLGLPAGALGPETRS
ncbi:HAD family hydrolase [Aeromicrobium duanguangcaii]|uniref:HAD family phosphatase n=1 Tax=Aeromicrobium duanguangcaii TaxID=2968086 RepID=A0ABY5KGX9_9ACTN|nr:HAD family phosphatase [Aeromicrobium duanguangcaii]MCD9153918.1 HAD family phosphatase [Aeromicrobium duanguangcaii]UUI69003.1 HAD family phosphatase [Aeromicrobium duanguangcaii]